MRSRTEESNGLFRVSVMILSLVGIVLSAVGAIHAAVPPKPPTRPPTPPTIPNAFPNSPSLSIPVAPSTARRSLLLGLNAYWSPDRTNWGRVSAQLKASGATITRVVVRWSDIEPKRGAFDWSGTDRKLRLIKTQGLALSVAVTSAPDWATGASAASRVSLRQRYGIGDRDVAAPQPGHYPDLTAFTSVLVARYKDIVHRWEFLPNADSGLATFADVGARPGTPQLYANLLRQFSAAARHADPTCLIAVGALSTTRADFLAELYAAGGRGAFDAIALAANEQHDPLPLDWIDACRQIAVRNGDDKKKFWISEYGWALYPNDPDGIVASELPRRIRAVQAELKLREFVEAAFYQSLNDAPPSAEIAGGGLMDASFRPRPGWQAFLDVAHGFSPKQIVPKSIPLLAGGPPAGAPAMVSFDPLASPSALPQLWRGVSAVDGGLGGGGRSAAALAKLLSGGGATFVRVTAPNIQGGPEAERAISDLVAGGMRIIMNMRPRASMTDQAWAIAVAAAVRTYGGNEARYGVERWEYRWSSAATAAQFATFASAVRAASPTAPIGIDVETDDPIAALPALAAAERASNGACDSLAWRLPSDPANAMRQVRLLRRRMAADRTFASIALWPELELGSDSAPAAAIAMTRRLIDAAPVEGRNAIGGIIAPIEAVTTDADDRAAPLDGLNAVNVIDGLALNATCDDSGVRGVGARALDGSIRVAIWREPGFSIGDRAALFRLRELPSAFLGGARIELTIAENDGTGSTGVVPRPITFDARPDPLSKELTIPFEFGRSGVVGIVARPHRASRIDLSLEAPKYSYLGGDEALLLVSVRNETGAVQRPTLTITASDPLLAPSALDSIAVGALSPGKSRSYRLRLPAPFQPVAETVGVEVAVGTDTRAALLERISPSIAASLEPARQDLAAASGVAQFTLRITNRSDQTALLNVNAGDRELLSLVNAPPGAQPIVRSFNLSAPSTEPGLYPLSLNVRATTKPVANLTALIGVPLACRYAPVTPRIDGDLREWGATDAMDMGRASQVKGREWGGWSDVSAQAWLKWDDRFLYFACAVTDDVFFQPFLGAELWKGDSVELAVSADRSGSNAIRPPGPSDHVFGLALEAGGGSRIYRLVGDDLGRIAQVVRGVASVRRVGDHTFYEAAIPWSELAPIGPRPGTVFGATVSVNDNDGQGLATISWGPGASAALRPGMWPPVRLTR